MSPAEILTLNSLTKEKLAKLFKSKLGGSATECKICIDFMNEAVQYLIEVIASTARRSVATRSEPYL